MAQSILIVDDEKEIVSMLYCYFSKLGYTVYTATAGNAALKEVEKKPDIILLDVNMPDIDGFTVCERIRDYVSCPIIFLTARIEDSDKIKGFSIGADDYVIKPFSVDELEARIAAHLRREKRHNISNALLLRLVGTYAALVLIIICFTILSVQQLTDTIEQKKQFQTISKLGVEQTDCGRYIRQQMIFKFGLPVMVSLIFSIGTILFLTLTGYEEYTVYISLNEMLTIFAVVYAAFIGILISYFVSTYYLFKKHMALS